MKHGDRGKPYIFKDNISGKDTIIVNEHRYDAGYDAFYEVAVVLNENPTPTEVFKVKLANPR